MNLVFVRASFQSERPHPRLGLQDGTFSPASIYDKTGSSPFVVDINRDYVPDIVIISGDSLE